MGAGWPSAPRNGWIGTSVVPRTADKNSVVPALGNPPTAKKPLRRRESCNLARPDRPLPSVSSRCRPAGLHPMRSHTPLNPVRPLPRRPSIFEARSVDLPLRDHIRTTCVRHRRPPLQTKDEQCWTIGSAPQAPKRSRLRKPPGDAASLAARESSSSLATALRHLSPKRPAVPSYPTPMPKRRSPFPFPFGSTPSLVRLYL